MYSPTVGRFITRDPIDYSDGNNLYQYVSANPVLRRDPTGLQGFNESVTVGGVTITVTSPAIGWPPLQPDISRGAATYQVKFAKVADPEKNNHDDVTLIG